MDNGEEERAVVDSLKQIVKHTSRRKTANKSLKQREAVVTLAPKAANLSAEDSSSGTGSSPQFDDSPPSDYGSLQENGVSILQGGSLVSVSIFQYA